VFVYVALFLRGEAHSSIYAVDRHNLEYVSYGIVGSGCYVGAFSQGRILDFL